MNTKIARQIEEMKKQTIVVEIEMADITRQNAIKVVADFFGTADTVSHDGGSYDAWSCKDPRGRRWTVTRDVSIRANNDLEKAELGTPILHYEDIENLQEIARRLRHAGAVSNPEHGCGVHCHIGANGHTAETLRNLANFCGHESLLAEVLETRPDRMNRYCRTVSPTSRRLTREPTMAALADIWYQDSYGSRNAHYNDTRYAMLNLHATFTKGTVEFRLFQFDNPTAERKGGIHAGQLKSYIQLCLALSQMAKEVRTASARPQQHENKYAMGLGPSLGFIGEV